MRKAFAKSKLLGRFRRGGDTDVAPKPENLVQRKVPQVQSTIGGINQSQEPVINDHDQYTEDEESALYDDEGSDVDPSEGYTDDMTEDPPSEYSQDYTEDDDEVTYEDSQGSIYDDDYDELYDDEEYEDSQAGTDDYDSQDEPYIYENGRGSYIETTEDDPRGEPEDDQENVSEYSDDTLPAREQQDLEMEPKDKDRSQVNGGAPVGSQAELPSAVTGRDTTGGVAGGAAAGAGILSAPRLFRGIRQRMNNTTDPYSGPDDHPPRRGFFSRLQRLGKRSDRNLTERARNTPDITSSSHGAVADLQRHDVTTRTGQLRKDAERDLVEFETADMDQDDPQLQAIKEGKAPRSAVVAPQHRTLQQPARQLPPRQRSALPPAQGQMYGHPPQSPSTRTYDSSYDYSDYSESATASPQRSISVSSHGGSSYDENTVDDEEPLYSSNDQYREIGSRSDPSEVLLHEGARRHMPKIVDPYERQYLRENALRPESIQPSVAEADSLSAAPLHSPLIPASGPLSAQRTSNDTFSTASSPLIAPVPRTMPPHREALAVDQTSGDTSADFRDAPSIPLTRESLSTLEQNNKTPKISKVARHTPSASAGTSDVYTAAQTEADTFVSASPSTQHSPARPRRRVSDMSGHEREQLRRRKGDAQSTLPVPPVPIIQPSEIGGSSMTGNAPPKRISDYYSHNFHRLEHKSPHTVKSRHRRENSKNKAPKEASNYLLTPSVAPTETESEQDGGEKPQEQPAASNWLLDDMSPEQLHYFVRELVSKELDWELDRAWLLTTFERPVRRLRDSGLPDDDSRINDFPEDEVLDDDEDEDAVFRRDVYEPQPGVPDLPILRFLLKNAFCTFPLFVQPHRRSKPNKPQPNKAAIARSFFFVAILPILRELQARSLSASVDRHGESDGSPFSAMSIMRGIMNVLHKTAVRYVTAVLRVGTGSPYFGGEEKRMHSWPWPSANLLPPEAYVSYRKATDRLRYGGFEVDIVAVRLHNHADRDFVLRIRRPNRTDEFVVRNDADWIEFAAKLAQELGPYVHVRPLPRLPGRDINLSSEGTTSSTYDTSNSHSSRSRTSRSNDSRSSRSNTLSDASETTYGRTESGSSYLDNSYDSDEYSDSGSMSGRENDEDDDEEEFTRRPRPMPKFEVDRRLLRSWLRDTLAIRSIRDSQEVRAFLTIGSFGDRELGTDDLLNIAERRRVDCRRIEEREFDAEMAGENVLSIRRVQQRIWADCVDGDGFLKAFDALKSTPDFWDLPTSYQTMISWGNLQLSRFLYGIFVQGDESRANLARARDLYETIPWRRLAAALRLPAISTVMEWQKQFLRNKFLQSLFQIAFEDNPMAMDEDLRVLQRAIGSDVMIKKLRFYVESPDDLKRLVRRHARHADIPLVAAIVRGSDAPKLSKSEIQRVILATRSYNEFLKTQPNAARKKAHKEPGYLLITNLQRVLRLYSLHRDVTQIRGMLQDPTILDALATFFDPLKDALMRIHRVKDVHVDLMHFCAYLGRLLDLLESLRARVQDPARSMNMIAAFLDRGAPHWYSFLHRLTQVDAVVFSAFAWLRHLAMTVGVGSEDLAQFWEPPIEAMEDADVEHATTALRETNLDAHNEAGGSELPQQQHHMHLDPAILNEAQALADAARRKRARQMEVGCRWSAGDTEGDFSIQVFGDGSGKIRQEPFLPKEPRPAPPSTALDILLRSFRDAVSGALTK